MSEESRTAAAAWKSLEDSLEPRLAELLRNHREQLVADEEPVVAARVADRLSMESAIGERWGPGFIKADLALAVLEEDFRYMGTCMSQSDDSMPTTFLALVALHMRARRVYGEILALLRAGYPDGADARARLLHELAVVSAVIALGGDDTARRYFDHQAIVKAKVATAMGYSLPMEAEDVDAKAIRAALEDAKQLCSDEGYGKPFKGDYGWAAGLLDNTGPQLRDLEEYAGRRDLRVLYKLSSANVHAGAVGIGYSLGKADETAMIPEGPSERGLQVPIRKALGHLQELHSCFLEQAPNEESILRLAFFTGVGIETNLEFERIAAALEAETTDSG